MIMINNANALEIDAFINPKLYAACLSTVMLAGNMGYRKFLELYSSDKC